MNITSSTYTVFSADNWIAYCRDGKAHRINGPAVEYTDGSPSEWWVNGEVLSEDEEKIAKEILSGSMPFEKLPLYVNHPLFKYFCLEDLKRLI